MVGAPAAPPVDGSPQGPGATLRLLIVDDHALVREGLQARLQSEAGISVVGEAASAAEALEVAAALRPDVVLMDVALRGTNGIEAARELLRREPRLRVLMLSMHDDPAYRRAAAAAGASGYVLKDSAASEIVGALRQVGAGGSCWTVGPGQASEALAAGAAATRDVPLTPREREVLALIAEGLSSREIGQRLQMGVRTVETHRTNLRRKLDLSSPAALVRFAVERRWVA
jgi:two-component system nitrate/nitrite response regulator NarL